MNEQIEKIMSCIEDAECDIKALDTVLEVLGCGMSGLAGGDVMLDIINHVRTSLDGVLATLGEAGVVANTRIGA